MNDYTRKNMRNRKRRIERRLGDRIGKIRRSRCCRRATSGTRWENRMRGLSVGGIGMMHQVARRTD